MLYTDYHPDRCCTSAFPTDLASDVDIVLAVESYSENVVDHFS